MSSKRYNPLSGLTPSLAPRPSPTSSDAFPPFSAWLARVSPELAWDHPHLKFIRARLADVTLGRCKKLAIAWPPQHYKTWSTTVRYPVWRMLREPGLRVGVGTYNQRYGNKISRWSRRLLERVGVAVTGAVDSWALPNGSTYIARGAGVGLAGEPVDLWICDDPFKNREQADSATVQEKVWEWHMDDVTPRIQQGGAYILIHTRWNAGDLIGRILKSADKDAWRFVRLPAIAETQEHRDRVHERLGLPLGQPDPLGRDPGAPLCPAAFDLAALEDKRRVQEIGFETLYQQDEVPRGGTFFQRDWFGLRGPLPDGCPAVRYWDLASSRKDSACYTSGVLMAKHGAAEATRYFVVDVVRGRWMPAERNDVMLQTARATGPAPASSGPGSRRPSSTRTAPPCAASWRSSPGTRSRRTASAGRAPRSCAPSPSRAPPRPGSCASWTAAPGARRT
jgi:hypothetical protein